MVHSAVARPGTRLLLAHRDLSGEDESVEIEWIRRPVQREHPDHFTDREHIESGPLPGGALFFAAAEHGRMLVSEISDVASRKGYGATPRRARRNIPGALPRSHARSGVDESEVFKDESHGLALDSRSPTFGDLAGVLSVNVEGPSASVSKRPRTSNSVVFPIHSALG